LLPLSISLRRGSTGFMIAGLVHHLDRMAREIAAVERMDEASTVAKIDDCSGWASDRYRSRTTSAMATPLAELILASYSCARRVRGSCP